jgi:hypothetical protein
MLDHYVDTRYWRFSHVSGHVACLHLRLAQDGRVRGYDCNNERYWRIEDGRLMFLNDDRQVTTIFTDQVETADGVRLEGDFLLSDRPIRLCLETRAADFEPAVLAANAVITRNVEPYAVVGGNPARHIAYRFDPETVRRLNALAWWDWPKFRLDALLPLMMSEDIATFLDAAEADLAPVPIPAPLRPAMDRPKPVWARAPGVDA